MKKILFKGAASAIPTPFTDNGINLEEFKKFLQFQIDNEIDALIVCGTTGESSTMTKDEKIIKIFRKVLERPLLMQAIKYNVCTSLPISHSTGSRSRPPPCYRKPESNRYANLPNHTRQK